MNPEPRINRRGLLDVLLLALLYFAWARGSLLWALESTHASPVGPPSGLAVVALWVGGARLLPGIIAGAMAANILGVMAIEDGLTLGAVGFSFGAALGSGAEAYAVWFLSGKLRAGGGFKQEQGGVLLRACLLGPLLAACTGALTMYAGGLAAWSQLNSIGVSWYLGDVVGILVVWPLAAVWWSEDRGLAKGSVLGGFTLLVAASIALAQVGLPEVGAAMLGAVALWAVSQGWSREGWTLFSVGTALAIARAVQADGGLLMTTQGILGVSAVGLFAFMMMRSPPDFTRSHVLGLGPLVFDRGQMSLAPAVAIAVVGTMLSASAWVVLADHERDHMGEVTAAALAVATEEVEREARAERVPLNTLQSRVRGRIKPAFPGHHLILSRDPVSAQLHQQVRQVMVDDRPMSVVMTPTKARRAQMHGPVPVLVLCGGTLLSLTLGLAFHLATVAVAAAAEAREAVRAKALFLATVSHEIRTPMNGILGTASLMASDQLSVVQRQRLDLVAESGRTLLTLIDDILDFTKGEAGKVKLETRTTDLKALCTEVTALHQAAAKARQVDISLAVPDDCRWLEIDSTRVRQIVGNLVSNAIKFSEGTRVDVSAQAYDDTFAVRVVDQGIGIPADRIEDIFRPFEQGDASIHRRFGGTGLGLAICRQLAEAMGGTLTCRSVVGRATVFTLRLPLVKADAAVVPTVTKRVQRPADHRMKVLVAEDGVVNQRVFGAMLARLGVEHDLARHGGEAIERFKENGDYDLIFMDLQMPEVDGLEATRAIRELEGDGVRVPIVAVTANAFDSDRLACMEAGMDGFVPKPFTLANLEEVLQEHVPVADAPLIASFGPPRSTSPGGQAAAM